MKKRRLRTTLWLGLSFGLLVMIALSLLSDFGKTASALRSMNLAWLPLILGLSLLHFVFRYFKWEFFLRAIGVRIRFADSVGIFLSGFVFTVTPGKMGEIFKAWLVREVKGEAVSKVIPVVIAERYTDMGGLLVLASLGVIGSGWGATWLLAFLFLTLIYLLAFSPWLQRLLPRLFGKTGDRVAQVLSGTRGLLTLSRLLPMVLFSALAWFWQCWALVFSLQSLGGFLSLGDSVFVFSLSTLAGALSFLPGGLGAAEGSMALLLGGVGGLDPAMAAAATLLIRLATLWFAVLVGLLALLWLSRRWNRGSGLWREFEKDGVESE
ncbi:MAG: lysylphosphatidylglycerol synthase transmembrane domain-containing protein [Candidatus Krumholzibacteria bacterium]|nr:lysylphosphatidylglycerol synthase transmembrane domain-containing protein [Candidatus Krumholzibacteria bacterium]MDP6796742.1 lysylphosphatidylglycerol synthase transmembrane domain-containing protein [Candidatus Krumholzibacteria bacterium]MDP7022357.1 lysylphosphatidylglycerol synthase transmembrane domain-containing protein [Candidatus Krumholzibacteria bacterium]